MNLGIAPEPLRSERPAFDRRSAGEGQAPALIEKVQLMDAPGCPGIAPTWTSSAKDMIGTALGPSRLWFTVGFGIINEVYYPRVDNPQIRDLGFIVGDGAGFWVEVKRIADYTVTTPAAGVPAVQILHRHPRFELALRVTPDPERDALLIEVNLTGDEKLKPYALLAPHLGSTGWDNQAEVFRNRGRRALCAEQGPFALALAAAGRDHRDAWIRASAGYVGHSDGWQDFDRNGGMTWEYERAGPGNVALTGELPRQAVLGLAFGGSKESATTLAISSLIQSFDEVWHEHVRVWEAWQAERVDDERFPREFRDELHVSAMVLKSHQDKTYPGAMVASLSIPWGNSSDDMGGYHLVWPRDLVESAGALLVLGAVPEAQDILRYLIATQLHEGYWSQNQWLGGTPRWGAVQLDEAGFPILLASALVEHGALNGIEAKDMVERALAFLVRRGPVTEQDRWEETAGINPFTLAITIAALVCGADLLDGPEGWDILLLADDWNAHIEEWCTASGGKLAERLGLARHYVRAGPARIIEAPDAMADVVPIKNRYPDPDLAARDQFSTDFLQLVRFGLRSPDDPIIVDTISAVDTLLKAETPSGAFWYRYNEDGYGEHEDGRPYNGLGRGRPWPLLAGERGHYALLAGEDCRPHLRAMVRASGKGALIPEQVWDSEPVVHYGLLRGRPTGSAMPLVWAHAEFVKLAASMRQGRPIDRPQPVWLRYGGRRPHAERAHWTPRMKVPAIRQGQGLRIMLEKRSLVHWTVDDWASASDTLTRPGVLGLQVADLPTDGLQPGRRLRFAVQDLTDHSWFGQDFSVDVIGREVS
jgi:glucoamylase